MDFTFRLNIGPNLENWFLKLQGMFSRVRVDKKWHENDATLVSFRFSYFGMQLLFGFF